MNKTRLRELQRQQVKVKGKLGIMTKFDGTWCEVWIRSTQKTVKVLPTEVNDYMLKRAICNAQKTARELCYSAKVRDLLDTCQSEFEISKIMAMARRREIA